MRKKLGSQISPAYDTDINHNVTARNIAGWEIDQKRCILIFAYIPYYHYLADPILEDGTVTELQIKDEACSYIDINSSIKLRFCFYYCESNQDKIKFTAGGVTNNAVTSHWSRVYIIKL